MSTDFSITLNEEILIEIFSRAPAKSVGKFRCLSKTWYAILSSSHFINLHLSRKTHQQSLILWTPYSDSLHVINPPIEFPTKSTKLELGNYFTQVVASRNGPVLTTQVVTSSNGLVLLLNPKNKMFLVNPITQELFQVPALIRETKDQLLFTLHGFGYDSLSDDYKIVAVPCSCSSIDGNENFSTYVYSIKSPLWRRSNQNSFHKSDIFQSLCGAFTNGSYHWIFIRKKELGILAFDFTNEVFYEVGVPLEFSSSKVLVRLFSHEGHLCAFSQLRKSKNRSVTGGINIWMMNEYGRVHSWTKLGSVDEDRNWAMPRPLYFSRDEESVLVVNEKTMVVCNLGEGIMNDVVVDGVPARFMDGCSFVGSLISLKGNTSGS